MFTENFSHAIGSGEWPAAELLMRILVLKVVELYSNPKSNVAARNIALEILAIVASRLLELQAVARISIENLSNENGVDQKLANLDSTVHIE
ncbi:hypothetical protein M433DRAFT_160533 [Acidomyces richmondensis BFW]|nr:hypothetical protein M433DRAFT_160533 [Acidomyces richmondensis BFW]